MNKKNTLLLDNIEKLIHDRQHNVRFWSVMSFFAVIVALFVYWQLHYVAISMTSESGNESEEYIGSETESEDETSLSYVNALTAGENEEGISENNSTENTNSENGIMIIAEEASETETVTEEGSKIATVAEEDDELVEVTITDTVLSTLDGHSYVITGNAGSYAMQAGVSNNGLSRVTIKDTAVSELSQWTFEATSGGFYISSDSKYLRMSYSTDKKGILSLETTKTDATVFTVSSYTYTGKTYLVISATVSEVTYYINMQDNGSVFVAYYNSPATGGDNSRLLLYSVETALTAVEYESVNEFYLWIYNGNVDVSSKVAGYSMWDDSSSGSNFSNIGIDDAKSYTDSDGTIYYLIPVSYFESSLGSAGYSFNENSTITCPFMYAPDADTGKTLDKNIANIKDYLYASYVQVDGNWYVRVTDTTGLPIPRSNIYYCPTYAYYLYVGSTVDTTKSGASGSGYVKTETITNYIGYGNNYVLIPVSCFSDYISESDLSVSDLTVAGADTINGVSYTLYESDFSYKTTKYGTETPTGYYVYYNGTWYIRTQDKSTSYAFPRTGIIWYTGDINYGVVLNLGNGNGTGLFTIYGTTDLRYTVALGSYVDTDGNVTINLPSDTDLSKTFTVATNGDNTATVALGKETAYDYKLVGWINIATGEYYDVSNGSTTAIINLANDNVFYADWIANTYDCVEDTTASNIISTADTSSFVTIRMYDFSELFNLYSTSLEQNGLKSETWNDSGVFYSSPLLSNNASNLTVLGQSFLFFDTSSPAGGASGRLSLPANRKTWNYYTGNDVTPADYKNSAYTGLYDQDIIDLLYSTDNSTSGTLGSYYVGEANYLFSYDETTGVYSYDAASNAAVYQQSDERFYVYNSPQTYNSGSDSIFLPYNSYSSSNSTYTASNGEINYWFGVNIELNFYLPNDTGTVLSNDNGTPSYGNQVNGGDMTFYFKGDDDVWVFVDDELVLDLGGIHSALKGEINFSTGTVTVTDANGKESEKSISDILDKNIAAGTHTLTFYYMERGAGASNMLIGYNTIPEWKYQSSSAGTMKVTKEWVDDNDENRPESIQVGLFEKVAVYSGSGSYTDTEGTEYKFDSDGYSYDGDGLVMAYISAGNVYIRVDVQTLSASTEEDKNWTYTWTLLDSSKSEYYQILELTTLTNYTTTSSYIAITEYDTYWTVEGYDKLNGDVTVTGEGNSVILKEWTGILKTGLKIILTDGSQNGVADTSGYPTTYSGYVIDTYGGSISTKKVAFSQKATQDANNQNAYTYGVTTNVPDTAVWTVVMAGGVHSFTGSNNVVVYAPTFYLQASNGKYLAVVKTNAADEYGLVLVDNTSDATAFSYNTLGELNTDETPGLRIIIKTDGSYALVSGRQSDTDTRNVKIYIPSTATVGSNYTITNTVLPTISLKKTDSDGSTTLTDVKFQMYQKDTNGTVTYYYSFDSTNKVIAWSTDPVELTTDTDGIITYKYLPDGTYYLMETGAADGYNLLTEELWFTVSGGKITAVSSSNYISIDVDDSNVLTIIVKNDPGRILPQTGTVVTARRYAFAGGIIAIISVLVLIRRRRKRSRIEY